MTQVSRSTRSWEQVAVLPEVDFAAQVATANTRLAERETKGDLAANDFWFPDGHWASNYRPYNVINGVLQIPIKGSLLNDFPWQDGSWATGYEYIREAIKRGAADPDVETIALIVNSPGGYVTGCFETGDAIFGARSSKRIVAFVSDHAYSAAYALVSAAHEIVVTRTGGVGSIGVVTSHYNLAGMYEQIGLEKTYIFAGKHKVDGAETAPLPADVKARIEERLSASYDVFVAAVARNRSMKEQAVRDTEALTYTALTAIDVGLADRIGTYDDAISADQAITSEEDDEMAITQADLDAAVSAAVTKERETAATASATAVEQARTEGASQERARIQTILTSDEAKGRPAAAQQAAFTLALPVETAKTFMSGMPVEKAAEATDIAAPKGMFESAMGDGKDGLHADVDAPKDAADLRKSDPSAYLKNLRTAAAGSRSATN